MSNPSFKIINKTAVITIEGSADIDSINQIHSIFSKAAASNFPVVLNIENTENCDITFVQLISSLCYSLHSTGRKLQFSQNTIPDQLFNTIKASGFLLRCKCTRIDKVDCPFSKLTSAVELKKEP